MYANAVRAHLKREPWGYAMAVLILVVYAVTLLPGLHFFGDTTKAQFLASFGGMTHPTGYPLYVFLTAPLSSLPVGSLAQRVNFFSAVSGTAAAIAVYGLCRSLGVRGVLSATGGALFAFSRIAWEQSVIAEVYALNAALVGAAILALVRWQQDGRTRHFLIACGVYALSFGNHLTVVTLLPAFMLGTALGPWKGLLKPQIIAAVPLMITIGAAQYGYLFWSSSSDSLYLEYKVETFDEFVNFVSGDHYRGQMLAFSRDELLSVRFPQLLSELARSMGPALLLAPAGALSLTKDARAWRGGAIVLTALVGEALWFMSYKIPDIEVYSVPIALFSAVFIAVALENIANIRATITEYVALGIAVFSVSLLVSTHTPDHSKSKSFEKTLDLHMKSAGNDAIVVGLVDYSLRMGWVYRLHIDGLSQSRNLHMAHSASPALVQKYLRGEKDLKDYYTRESLPPGMRVLIAPRAQKQQDWGTVFDISKKVGPLREVRLK